MKKHFKYCLFTFLFFFGLAGWAQEDSTLVWQQFQSALDEENMHKAIEELKSASAAANSNKLLYLDIEIKKELAPRYFIVDNSYEGLRTYFQLIGVLSAKNKNSDLYNVFINLSNYYQSEGLPNNSANYRLQAMQLADSTHLIYPKGELLYEVGLLKLEALEYNDALKYLHEADDVAQQKGNNYLLLKVLRALAKTYEYKGEIENSAVVNLRILKLLENSDDRQAYTRQLNNMGFIEQKFGNTDRALNYFLETLKERESMGLKDVDHVVLLINIGVSYKNIGKPRESKNYFERALNAAQKNKNTELEAEIYNLISVSYLAEDDLYNATIYNKNGLVLMNGNYPNVEMDLYLSASHIYEKLLEYDIALDYYKKYLNLKDSLDSENKLNQEALLQQQLYVEKTEKEVQALVAKGEIKDYQLNQLKLESENKDVLLQNQSQALQLKKGELEQLKKEKEIEEQRTEIKQREVEEVKQKNEILNLENEAQTLASETKALESEAKIKDLEILRRRSINRNLIIIVFLTILVMILALFAVFKIRKSSKTIQLEKAKSDKLLLNILPKSTAEELKSLGQSLPRSYNSATVLFTDFKGFTQITEKMLPENLVENLGVFFIGFDSIMKKFGLEKIKTIGDAYMCAAGIPEPLKQAEINTVLAAKEMLKLTEDLNRVKRKEGLETWEIRIGINTGPVVAGVIGSHKFQYDVWGDTVNLAARMESSGSPGKINISESTYQKIKDKINCTYRGEIEAKNKGKVKMYFVD